MDRETVSRWQIVATQNLQGLLHRLSGRDDIIGENRRPTDCISKRPCRNSNITIASPLLLKHGPRSADLLRNRLDPLSALCIGAYNDGFVDMRCNPLGEQWGGMHD